MPTHSWVQASVSKLPALVSVASGWRERMALAILIIDARPSALSGRTLGRNKFPPMSQSECRFVGGLWRSL